MSQGNHQPAIHYFQEKTHKTLVFFGFARHRCEFCINGWFSWKCIPASVGPKRIDGAKNHVSVRGTGNHSGNYIIRKKKCGVFPYASKYLLRRYFTPQIVFLAATWIHRVSPVHYLDPCLVFLLYQVAQPVPWLHDEFTMMKRSMNFGVTWTMRPAKNITNPLILNVTWATK